MTTRRLYVQTLDGPVVTLDDEAAHYARDVLRLVPGAAVTLFDGAGLTAPAVIEAIDRRAVTARLTASPTATSAGEPQRRLIIAAAIPKGERWEWLIEKVCEAGATELWPLHTARGVVQISPDKAADKVARWHKIAVGAARQCHRARPTQITAPMTPREAIKAAQNLGALTLLPHTGGHDTPLLAAAATASGEQPIVIFIGPEGGWTGPEVDELGAAGAKLVHLGPRVLRAETAAVVACALAQAAAGDLHISNQQDEA